ncbi:MAG: hypothetical protein AAGC65_20585 [Mucilaginibacter sp.]|uniref:hypothetical protein n=1 Tax=Mucilaginibacter sp. TaxID=1882438 RepID=UPI0031AE366B
MIRNTFIILLCGALFACNQSPKKDSAADQSADTGKVQQPLLNDSTAPSPASTDTSKIKTTSTQLIVPGRSIGNIQLNEDVANVSTTLGRPDSSDAAMGSSLMVWFAGHNPAGYRTSVFAHRNMGAKDEIISRIRKILITSPAFKTAEGLGVGSPEADIKKSYDLKPTSDYKNKNGKVQVYTDMDKGISFEIDATGKCVGVVVHQLHDTAAAYLNMH